MATTIIKRSELPVAERGGKVSVRIAENGQFGVSKKGLEVLSGRDLCLLQFDNEGRKLSIKGYAKGKTPNKVKEEECFEFKTSEKSRGSGAYFSASGVWKQLGYDYRASGAQTFTEGNGLEVNGQSLILTVPEGALPPRPKQRRRKAAAENGQGEAQAAASTPEQPEEGEESQVDDDLNIE